METDDAHDVPPNISQFKRPENPPGFFGVDIDGTLFTRNEEALQENIKAFAKVRQMGYTPFFCTGRSVESSLAVLGSDFVERTGYKGYPGVYFNGSLVYDENREIVYSQGFSKDFIVQFGKFLLEKNLTPHVIFYTQHCACSLSPLYERLLKFSLVSKLPNPSTVTFEELLQENILIIKYAEFDITLSGLRENVDYTRTITLSDWLYTINPVGINKALGLKKFMEYYGLQPGELGFVGDGNNDTEAMEFCNISFCVNGKPSYIKKCAKWVLENTCNEGAVAEALELVYGLK